MRQLAEAEKKSRLQAGGSVSINPLKIKAGVVTDEEMNCLKMGQCEGQCR